MNQICKYVMLCFWCIQLPLSGWSQPLGAADKIKQAESFLVDKNTEKALQSYQDAIAIAGKADDLSNWLCAQRGLAKTRFDLQKKPYEAIQGIEYALSHVPRKAVNSGESEWLCKLLCYQSWVAKSVGDWAMVKRTLEAGLDIFNNQLQRGNEGLAAYIYMQLGNAYARLGEREAARQLFETGIAYSLEFKKPEVAKYNDYGTIYQRPGEYPKALEIFQNGLRHEGLPTAEWILLQLNIAECLIQLDRPAEARVANQKASAAINKPSFKSDARYGRCLYSLQENYALLAAHEHQIAASIQWYEKAIVITQQDNSVEPRVTAGFYLDIAELALAQNKVEAALQHCANAYHELLPVANLKPGEYPSLLSVSPENLLVRAIDIQARCFGAQGKWDEALAGYELIPQIETLLRRTHDYESSSLEALAASRQRFAKALDIAWDRYATTGNARYAQRAFFLTEQARGLLLLESLAQSQDSDMVLPDSLRQKKDELARLEAWYPVAIAQARKKGDQATQKQLEQGLFDLKQAQNKLEESFRKNYGAYAELSKQEPVVHADKAPQLLRKGQAMLHYYVSENKLYVFFLDNNGLQSWRRADLSPDFHPKLRRYIGMLNGSQEAESKAARLWFQDQSFQLYTLLAGPELGRAKDINSLVVVPDELLSFIPFEILFTKASKGDWATQPYLLRDYAVGYAYSASLLHKQQQISALRKPAPRLFGGFAPQYAPKNGQASLNREGYADLPGAQEELSNVCQLMAGDPFIGPAATEAVFKNKAANYRMLLLSMHGLADEENPVLSRLVFSNPGPLQEGEDNQLTFSELQVLRLQADLAVLSACQTGAGKLQSGEGVYSLSRAFAAAGVPATVMSLWLLPDLSAPQIIESFFQGIKNGQDKDKALQQAKLDFLLKKENAGRSFPAYWAGLVLNGDLSPIDTSGFSYWWLLLPAILMAFLLSRRLF